MCVLVQLIFCTPAYMMFHILCLLSETRVQIQESVRGKDVFIIQTVSKYGKIKYNIK